MDVQEEMKGTLKKLLSSANKDYATTDRKKFVVEKKG
jgi:hypothetical protein